MTYYESAKKHLVSISKQDICKIIEGFSDDVSTVCFGFSTYELCAECRKRFSEDVRPCSNTEIEDRDCPLTTIEFLNLEVSK